MILTLTILQVVAREDDYFLLLCYKRNPQRLMSMLFLKIQLGEYVESIIYSLMVRKQLIIYSTVINLQSTNFVSRK